MSSLVMPFISSWSVVQVEGGGHFFLVSGPEDDGHVFLVSGPEDYFHVFLVGVVLHWR